MFNNSTDMIVVGSFYLGSQPLKVVRYWS